MRKVKIGTLRHQLQTEEQRLAEAAASGHRIHTPVNVPGLSSRQNIFQDTYLDQLAAYRADAAKLSSDADRIAFWLKKAEKNNRRINTANTSMLHNDLLEKRTYLREAIALGSVQAALEQDQLIQTAVNKKVYNLLGADLCLIDPIMAAAVRISPMINLYFSEEISEQEKLSLSAAITAALPTEPAGRASMMQLLLKNETDPQKRNVITRQILQLTSSAPKSISTVAYSAASSSSATTSNNNNAGSSSGLSLSQ
ncbi:MAG: hypothetical protein ABSF18_00510 [Gammaproteobacteria bacterium]